MVSRTGGAGRSGGRRKGQGGGGMKEGGREGNKDRATTLHCRQQGPCTAGNKDPAVHSCGGGGGVVVQPTEAHPMGCLGPASGTDLAERPSVG